MTELDSLATVKNTKGKIMGVDFGDTRTGISVCDASRLIASGQGYVSPGGIDRTADAVAELAIGMMIYMSRNGFNPGTGSELSGKRLGIIGFGNIGQLIAKKAVALGMEVLVKTDEVKEKHKRWDMTFSFDKLYHSCDFVSVNIPATPMTKGSVKYDYLMQMPKGGCLINTARKELICEEGLMKALTDRPDLKYATDVAPACIDELKEKFGNRVFATPKKMGAETGEANVNAGLAAAHQIVNYFEIGCVKFQVNK